MRRPDFDAWSESLERNHEDSPGVRSRINRDRLEALLQAGRMPRRAVERVAGISLRAFQQASAPA